MRGATARGLSALAAVTALVAGWSGVTSGATARPIQVITVDAARSTATTATLRTWDLVGGRYRQVFPARAAFVGWRGVGRTHEGAERTPAGVFSLTRAFGSAPNPGTRLPYLLVGPDDWWDENPASPQYNRLVVSTTSPGGDSENLLAAGHAYAHAIVINYNTDPVVPGAGSGFFLHVSFGAPTEGCVAIGEGALDQILRWLNPADHPVISIGVGRAALAPVRPVD